MKFKDTFLTESVSFKDIATGDKVRFNTEDGIVVGKVSDKTKNGLINVHAMDSSKRQFSIKTKHILHHEKM